MADRREWWHDDAVMSMRLPDGTWPRYEHGRIGNMVMATIHGDQYCAPWNMPGRGRYVVDDFGDWMLQATNVYGVRDYG